MATFSLSNTNGVAVTRLQPWTITPVVFKGVEEKTGTSKDGSTWKAIQFKFSGDKGIFEPMFFCPKEGGDKRNSGETDGRKWELPSQIEQLALAIAHIVGTLSPANKAGMIQIKAETNYETGGENKPVTFTRFQATASIIMDQATTVMNDGIYEEEIYVHIVTDEE